MAALIEFFQQIWPEIGSFKLQEKTETLNSELSKMFGLRSTWGRRVPVLGLLFMASAFTAPRAALANSGTSFFETIGFGIAMGTVLGASTLPFYDQPGSHTSNLALGAAVGFVAGLGWEIFGGSSSEVTEKVAISGKPKRPLERSAGGYAAIADLRVTRSPAFWTPVVSLTW